MGEHVCPWWGGYFIDNRLRRWIHNPERILGPYLEPGMTALDFGCGMGLFSIAMARRVGDAGRVIAVDLQQQMLDVLMARAAKAGVARRIRTHRCQPDAIGLAEPVDFALASYSAHEVPDQRRLLAEIHNLLHPGGRFLVIEPRGHVSAAAFEQTVSLAEHLGFTPHDRPHVRFSRAVILRKAQPATAS